MLDTSFRNTEWYKSFLSHPEFARRPNKHPQVAEFIKEPGNLAIYLKDAKEASVEYLKYLPSFVFEPSLRAALIEFLSRKGYELEYLPKDLKKDEEIIRTALGSDPRAIYFLDDHYRDDAEFVLPYLIKNPIIVGLLSERLQNDIEFLSQAVSSSQEDVLALFPEEIRQNSDLVKKACIAIFQFGSEDSWDNVDWAKLRICADGSWTFKAACGTRQYEGLGYSQIDLEEFSVSGTWKKINQSIFRLTPSALLNKFHRIGESQSTELFPRGSEAASPIDLSYSDLNKGMLKMKRQFSTGEESVFQILYGVPQFLL